MLLDNDSFNGYTSAELSKRFTQLYGLGGTIYGLGITGTGPRGNYCLEQAGYNNNSGQSARQVIVPGDTKFVHGLRFRLDGAWTDSFHADNNTACSFLFKAALNGAGQWFLKPNDDGTVSFYRGTPGSGLNVFLGSSLAAIPTTSWEYIEIEVVTRGGTDGSVRFVVNDVTFLNLTGINTTNDGGDGYNEYFIPYMQRAVNPATYWRVADMYFCDGVAGDGWHAIRGAQEINPNYITTEGALTDSTPLGLSTTDRAVNVKEGAFAGGTGPDGDTGYNLLSVVSDKDSFNHEPAPNTGASITGRVLKCFTRKDSAGTALLKLGSRVGSTNYFGSDLGLAATYRYIWQPQGVNPATGLEFTEAEHNADQYAYEKSA